MNSSNVVYVGFPMFAKGEYENALKCYSEFVESNEGQYKREIAKGGNHTQTEWFENCYVRMCQCLFNTGKYQQCKEEAMRGAQYKTFLDVNFVRLGRIMYQCMMALGEMPRKISDTPSHSMMNHFAKNLKYSFKFSEALEQLSIMQKAELLIKIKKYSISREMGYLYLCTKKYGEARDQFKFLNKISTVCMELWASNKHFKIFYNRVSCSQGKLLLKFIRSNKNRRDYRGRILSNLYNLDENLPPAPGTNDIRLEPKLVTFYFLNRALVFYTHNLFRLALQACNKALTQLPNYFPATSLRDRILLETAHPLTQGFKEEVLNLQHVSLPCLTFDSFFIKKYF